MNLALSPGSEDLVVAERGGASVTLRRLTHDDASEVADLHAGLPELDRYRRFFSTHPVDAVALAESLTVQSQLGETVGAFKYGRLIGVANYARCDQAQSADVAIVVAHAEQQRGVGTMLMRYLAELAVGKGITQLTADFLADNHLILGMFRELGLSHTIEHTDREVLHASIDLTAVIGTGRPR